MSMMGLRFSTSSTSLRLTSSRGSKNTGWNPSSVSFRVAELVSTASSPSPMPCITEVCGHELHETSKIVSLAANGGELADHNKGKQRRYTRNWYSAWLPNSEAAKRKPVFSTQMEVHGGMVSKYFIFSSVTASPSYARVILYRSPYSLCRCMQEDRIPAALLIVLCHLLYDGRIVTYIGAVSKRCYRKKPQGGAPEAGRRTESSACAWHS